MIGKDEAVVEEDAVVKDGSVAVVESVVEAQSVVEPFSGAKAEFLIDAQSDNEEDSTIEGESGVGEKYVVKAESVIAAGSLIDSNAVVEAMLAVASEPFVATGPVFGAEPFTAAQLGTVPESVIGTSNVVKTSNVGAAKDLIETEPYTPSLRVPLDIIGVMAEHLVGMDLYATCALLNSTSKAVREETSPVLWRRVVYRWNNSQNGRKKSAVKWKITFSCPAAKYIQYLLAIPSCPPDVAEELSPWEPPFLQLLRSGENHLKAVVIAGNALTVAAIIYNDGYHPGTNDLLTTIGLACLAQDLTGCRYESLILRPVFDDTRSDSPDIPFDANHLDAIILAHEKTLWTKLVGLLHRHRLKSISVSLSSVSTCHVGYVTYFLGEVLTMQQLPAKNQRMSKIQMGKSSWGSSIGTELNVIWPKLEFNVKSAARRYLAGVSKLIDAAYRYSPDYGRLHFNVQTNENLGIDGITAFFSDLERSYLALKPQTRHEIPEAITVTDTSANKFRGRKNNGKKRTLIGKLQHPQHPERFASLDSFPVVRAIGYEGEELVEEVVRAEHRDW